jgi:hypothetical protein
VDVQLGAYANGYKIPSDLIAGREYVARVSTPSGDLSRFRYFTPQCTAGAPPGTASLSWPPGGSTHTRSPLFVWEDTAQATDYHLWVVNSSSVTEVDQVYSALQICSGGQCAVPTPTPLSLGRHTWQVQAANAAGTGPLSTNGVFIVGP